MTIASGATLDLNGASQQVASLSDYARGNAGSVTNSGTNPAVLVLSPTGGSTTFSGVISDGTGGVSVVMNGNGTQVLAGSNAYSGATMIDAGELQAIDGMGLPATSNLIFNGKLAQTGVGAVFQTSGTFSRALGTAAGQVQWTGDGGFAANGGPLTVSMSPGVALVWGGTQGFVGNGSALTFGSPTANNQVNFTDSIDLSGGTRQIYVAQGTGGDTP